MVVQSPESVSLLRTASLIRDMGTKVLPSMWASMEAAETAGRDTFKRENFSSITSLGRSLFLSAEVRLSVHPSTWLKPTFFPLEEAPKEVI